MAKLRLFANLREIAGTSRVEIPSSETVGDVLNAAADRFGPDFKRSLGSARVWINGEVATLEQSVTEDDEVVLIPPVSGGSQRASTASSVDLMAFAPLVVALIAVLASLQSQAIWAAAVVAIVAVWALDLGSAFSARRRMFAPLAVTVTAAGSAMAAHVIGGAGYGIAILLAVAVGLGWGVAVKDYRDLAVLGPVVTVSLFAGLATASMVLATSAHSPETSGIDVFLVAVIAGILFGAVAERMPALPLVDPFTVTALGAVVGAVVAAAIWDLDVVGYLLVGLGLAIALVAGRGFSSILRTGGLALTQRPPGLLSAVDAAVLAAAIYYPLLGLVF